MPKVFVAHEKSYTHKPKWRDLSSGAFRLAHMFWDDADDYGLLCIESEQRLRYHTRHITIRSKHIHQILRELKDAGIIFQYRNNTHGEVVGLPDYPLCNTRKYPKASLYTPVPFEVIMAFPDYFDIISRYQGKRPDIDPVDGKPTVEQGVALWNTFAHEHNLPMVSAVTPQLTRHWNARCKEALFDLEAILKHAKQSEFLMGRKAAGGRLFRLTFHNIADLTGKVNYVKILDGNYADRKVPAANSGSTARNRAAFVPNVKNVHETIFGATPPPANKPDTGHDSSRPDDR